MRLGKLPENIYSRSVDKRIRTHNNKFKGAAIGYDCAFLCAEGSMLSKDQSMYAEELRILFRYVYLKAAAVAGKPAVMQAQLVLPVEFAEAELREFIRLITEYAYEYKLTISGVDVTSSDAISQAQLNLILLGTKEERIKFSYTKKNKQRCQLVYIGRTAATGTAWLAGQFFDELSQKYSKDYVRRMVDLYREEQLTVPVNILFERIDYDFGIRAIGEGGIFAALWNLGREMDCGLRVELKKIPVFQETIELCDFFDINPYMLDSRGDCLVLTDDADALVDKLNGMMIEASFIGVLTEDNDRVIINNDEERFLTAPEQDELFRALQSRR